MRDTRGKILEYSKSKAGLSALLYNFDVGIAAVKAEHVQWLRENLRPYSGSSTLRTTVIGFASRSGRAEANQSLSIIRAHTMEQVIWGMGGPPVGHNPYPAGMAFGEYAAAFTGDPDAYENERWRSVFVLISEPGKPPELPKPVFKAPKLRRILVTFTMEATAAGQLSGGGEPGDRSATMSARASLMLYGSPITEYFALVPADATLSEIIPERVDTTAGLSQIGIKGMMEVTVKTVQIKYIYTVGGKPRPTLNGKSLDTDDLSDWITDPSKKYLRTF